MITTRQLNWITDQNDSSKVSVEVDGYYLEVVKISNEGTVDFTATIYHQATGYFRARSNFNRVIDAADWLVALYNRRMFDYRRKLPLVPTPKKRKRIIEEV